MTPTTPIESDELEKPDSGPGPWSSCHLNNPYCARQSNCVGHTPRWCGSSDRSTAVPPVQGDDWLRSVLSNLYNIGRHEEAGGLTDREQALSETKAAIQAQLDAAYQRGQDEKLSPIPMVNGLDCPACGHPTLILGNGGYITCSLEDCPNPDYAEAAQAQVDEAVRAARVDEATSALGVANNHRMDTLQEVINVLSARVKTLVEPSKEEDNE